MGIQISVVAASISGSNVSSASRKSRYSELAARAPRLREGVIPRLAGCRTNLTRLSRLTNSATTSTVPSVLPSSTTVTFQAGSVWASRLRSVSATNFSAL